MRIKLLLSLSLAALLYACGGNALVATNPTASEVQQARVAAARMTDAVQMAIDLAVKGSDTLDTLQVSQTVKDDYRCAFLKVNGVPQASSTVSRVCGPVPLTADTVLRKAVVKLHDVTTCPGVRTTGTEVLNVVDPFVTKLSESTDATLRMLAFMLQTAFRYTRQFVLAGGTSCSST